MTALALRGLLPGEMHATGLAIPPTLTFEEWAEALHRAEWLEAASPWFVVDLVAWGERRFGEDASQAYPTVEDDPSGVRQAKLKQAAWMASKFPPSTRVPELSYTHHRAVAELEPDDRRALLEEAVTEALSTRALIERVRERQTAISAEATAAASAPACAADDLTWTPTVDDLTDACQARLRFELGQRRERHPEAFTAGWLAALVWLDALDCFKREPAP